MRNAIKSYHVFLSSKLFQVLLYVLYLPVMMFGVGVLLRIVQQLGMAVCVGYQLSANLLFVGEVVWGLLIFGGVAAKDTNKLEYLKTSAKGMSILKTALAADVVRRFLWVTLIQWVPLFIIHEKADENVWMANAMVLLFAEMGCLLVRKGCSMAVFLAVMVGGTTFLSPLLGLSTWIVHLLWPIVLCYVLAVVVVIYNIKMVMKKARDSFYDDRNEKMSEAV